MAGTIERNFNCYDGYPQIDVSDQFLMYLEKVDEKPNSFTDAELVLHTDQVRLDHHHLGLGSFEYPEGHNQNVANVFENNPSPCPGGSTMEVPLSVCGSYNTYSTQPGTQPALFSGNAAVNPLEQLLSPACVTEGSPHPFSPHYATSSCGPPSNSTDCHSEFSDSTDGQGSIMHVSSLIAERADIFPSKRSPEWKEKVFNLPGLGELKITIKNPQHCYNKVQRRVNEKSQQRIQGVVGIMIKSEVHPVSKVDVFVQRDPTVAKAAKDDNGPVLWHSLEFQRNSLCDFSINLDEKYETEDGKLVYKLAQNNIKKRNKFQLVVDLQFHDVNFQVTKLMIYEFQVKSQATDSVPGVKRRKTDSDGKDTDQQSTSSNIKVVGEMVVDYFSAKFSNLPNFQANTTKGDIGYYFAKYVSQNGFRCFEEGDVIVLVKGEDGNVKIDLLTRESFPHAILAGVVTRQAYLKARRPGCWADEEEEGEDHEVVCVIGMVPVRVKGPVQMGERVYTSDEDGTAVAESQLDPTAETQPIWVGFAMQSDSETSSRLLDTFVSILLGMADQKVETVARSYRKQVVDRLETLENKLQDLSQGHRELEQGHRDLQLGQRVLEQGHRDLELGHRDLEDSVNGLGDSVNCLEGSVDHIKKTNRGCKIKVSVSVLVLILIGVLGYIFLAPGSPYVKGLCQEQSLKNSLSLELKPDTGEETIHIEGIGFKWSVLKKKLGLDFDEIQNGTDFKYFLNKYRCETGQIRRLTSWLDPSPQFPRNNVLAANKKCDTVHYYSKKEGKWYKYSDNEIENIKCKDA